LKYKIYHIFNKKIGVTRDLYKRVTEQQGYAPGEYEVLLESDDIDLVSDLELELQQSYGYKVDSKPYNQLYKNQKPNNNNNNNMKINATEQTSTFPCPVNKLKGRLMDNKGLTWETDHGEFEINSETIPWIVANAKTSMYNPNRCYIYNKAYNYVFLTEDTYPQAYSPSNHSIIFERIRNWAQERGLYDSGDLKTQYIKLIEESGELARAILKHDDDEFVDAIGDMVVVLTNLAHLGDTTIERCIDSAYNTIANRTGSMINGTFVKD